LAISSAMALTGMFQWGVRQSAEVENQMTSVERVIEYSKLPSEAALESTKGLNIIFERLHLINFHLNRQETSKELAGRRQHPIQPDEFVLQRIQSSCFKEYFLLNQCQREGIIK